LERGGGGGGGGGVGGVWGGGVVGLGGGGGGGVVWGGGGGGGGVGGVWGGVGCVLGEFLVWGAKKRVQGAVEKCLSRTVMGREENRGYKRMLAETEDGYFE